MKSILKRYKILLKYALVLTIILSVLTILHIIYRKYVIKNNIWTEKKYENNFNDYDYNYLKKDLDNIDDLIKKSESLSFNENIYKIEFFKKASEIFEMKLVNITKIINDKMIDDESKSTIKYEIEKFYNDLSSDEEREKRQNESTIIASLNVYKNKYNKTKEKCYKIISDYRAILDN